MSGETAKAKTSVFWDVDDCPIPSGVDPKSIYRNIKSALANEDYDCCNLEFKAYGGKETLEGLALDAGTTFVPKVAKHVREMVFDILAWALDSPAQSNLLLISKFTPNDVTLVATLEGLAMRGYNVLLAQPDKVEPFAARSVWLWTSLSNGGSPMEPRGIKRTRSVYTLEPQPDTLLKPNFQNLFATPCFKKTGVFWDLEDYPIPWGLQIGDLAKNFESALAAKGFPGNTSFRFYVQEQDIPDGEMAIFKELDSVKEGRIAFYPEIKDQVSRVEWMLLHSYFWAIDNPVSGAEGEDHRVMLISQRLLVEPEFISALKLKGYQVFLVHNVDLESFFVLSRRWLFRSMFHRWVYCPNCV